MSHRKQKKHEIQIKIIKIPKKSKDGSPPLFHFGRETGGNIGFRRPFFRIINSRGVICDARNRSLFIVDALLIKNPLAIAMYTFSLFIIMQTHFCFLRVYAFHVTATLYRFAGPFPFNKTNCVSLRERSSPNLSMSALYSVLCVQYLYLYLSRYDQIYTSPVSYLTSQ